MLVLKRNRFQICSVFVFVLLLCFKFRKNLVGQIRDPRRIPGRRYMIIISILLTIFMTSVIVFSLCRIPSRAYANVCHKSLIFDNQAETRRLDDLLSDGDAESVHRILKALQQRGDVDIFESESDIYVSGRRSVSVDQRRTITRDLVVSDYDPIEDFRNLSVMSRFNTDAQTIHANQGVYVSKYEAPYATNHEESKDDLFASAYDVIELLENLNIRSCCILTVQTPS